MPSLPIYNANRNIQANTVAPLQTGAEQPFIDQQKVIKTVADIGQKWSDAQDVMDYTKFKAETGAKIALKESEAANDPDENNSQKHIEELNKIKETALVGFHNKGLANKVAYELNHDISISSIKIDAEFKKKQMLTNEMNLDI